MGEETPQSGGESQRAEESSGLRVGSVVDGRYRIEKLIAEGGFSSVYRAIRLDDHADIALKVLFLNAYTERLLVERFQREAELVSRLTSPNTVRIHHWGSAEDPDAGAFLFTAMEYIGGRSLRRQIKKHGALTVRQVAEVAVQLCDSLIEAHEAGFLHRDLKPSNVMLYRDDEGHVVAKLLDFGVAKIMEPDGQFQGLVTHQGMFVGTPRYASPEQLRREPLSTASDVYGLGMVMWEAMMGQAAVPDSGYAEAVKHHLLKTPWKVPDWVDCPPEFAAIVEKTLAKDPDQRYESCVELKAVLQRWLVSRYAGTSGSHTLPLDTGEIEVTKKETFTVEDLEAEDELFGEVIEKSEPIDPEVEVMESHDLSESSAARAARMQIAKRNSDHAGIDFDDRPSTTSSTETSAPNVAITIGIIVVAVLAGLYVLTMGSNDQTKVDPTPTTKEADQPTATPTEAAAKDEPAADSDEGRGDGTPTLPADTIIKGMVASGWRVGAPSVDKMDDVKQTNVLAEKDKTAATVTIYESRTWEWAEELKLTTEPPAQAVSFGRTIVRVTPGPPNKSNGVVELKQSLDEFKQQAREKATGSAPAAPSEPPANEAPTE